MKQNKRELDLGPRQLRPNKRRRRYITRLRLLIHRLWTAYRKRELLDTWWLRLLIYAAGKMGFTFMVVHEEHIALHFANSDAVLLASMRDHIQYYEEQAAHRKKEALES
jgi:hypothetical protein